jgi:hypothetical protein
MHLKPRENIKYSLSLPCGAGSKWCLVGLLKLEVTIRNKKELSKK